LNASEQIQLLLMATKIAGLKARQLAC